MIKCFIFYCCIYLLPVKLQAQLAVTDSAASFSIDFVSDTQQPLFIEKLYRRTTHNIAATAKIFSAILRNKPAALFMLGDIVSLGYSDKKWKKVDLFLDSARQQGIKIYGLLGNHDVLFCDRAGERNFNQRFPEQRRTGYTEVVDSIAVVLLNANFGKLSAKEIEQENQWYIKSIYWLNNNAAVKGIIVSSHQPVFTNSKAVKPSKRLTNCFLPAFVSTKKCILFITGHAHTFEHFRYQQKDFLVIGGGGGIHQKLKTRAAMPEDVAAGYKPLFHYLHIKRYGNLLQLTSDSLKTDFSGFSAGHSFSIHLPY